MKKYINFSAQPGFLPMWNPLEMLEAGVHGGCTFSSLNIPVGVVKTLWPKLDKVKKAMANKKYSTKHNYFGVYPQHGEFDYIGWFKWYIGFYLDHDNHQPGWSNDKRQIGLWVRALWRVWDEIYLTQDPLSKKLTVTEAQKQTLLELAWNWEHEPNFDKKFMFETFPLIINPLITNGNIKN